MIKFHKGDLIRLVSVPYRDQETSEIWDNYCKFLEGLLEKNLIFEVHHDTNDTGSFCYIVEEDMEFGLLPKNSVELVFSI